MKRIPLPIKLYVVVSGVHLLALWYGWPRIAWATKPLLMIVLGWYWLTSQHQFKYHTVSHWISAAIMCALLGDVLLEIAKQSSTSSLLWFSSGLGAFLLAQICYIVAFVLFPPRGKGLVQYRPWWLILLMAYSIYLLWSLWPGLPTPLKGPVVVYSLALTLMVATTMNLGGRLASAHYRAILWGALLFLLSDSLIGISRFRPQMWSWPHAQFWIMLTYITGQALIVKGAAQALSTHPKPGL